MTITYIKTELAPIVRKLCLKLSFIFSIFFAPKLKLIIGDIPTVTPK